MLMRARVGAAALGQKVRAAGPTASSSCSSLALLVGLTIAIYNKTFTTVVHVTLQDRPGRQPAGAAGRRQAARDDRRRGARRSAPTAQARPSTLALQPETVGLIPANVVGPAAAQDAVR